MQEAAFLAEVRQIVAALEDVVAGGPDAGQFQGTRWIHDWTVVTRGRDIPSLYGRVADGPDAVGEEMATADLLHLDAARGLARTRQGWLRLGARADATRRKWMRETFGDGSGQIERLARDMGEGLWPIEDADIAAMLDAWPLELLVAVQDRGEPDVTHRLDAVIQVWLIRYRTR